MADKKISELTEQKDLTNVQAIGVKTANGSSVACRFNIGNISQMVQDAVTGVVKPSEMEEFDSTKNYFSGQYATHNSKHYRFIKTHWAGAWRGDSPTDCDVVETDFWSEISSVTSTDVETVHCDLSIVDATGTPVSGATLGDRTVTIQYGDTSPYPQEHAVTNSNGICTFMVRKGVKYTIVSQTIDGYAKPIDQQFVASIGHRYVQLVYRPGTDETCSLTVTVNTVGRDASGYNNQKASVILNYRLEKPTTVQATMTYDSSTGKATAIFNGLPQGAHAFFALPPIANYITPENKEFIVNGLAMNFDVDVEGVTSSLNGIYYVDKYDWNEYLIDDFPHTGVDSDGKYILAEGHECVAVHVATEVLTTRGFDYYVRFKDLTSVRPQEVRTGRKWSGKTNLELPHVTKSTSPTDTIAYNGPRMTGYMLADSILLNQDTSDAALAAASMKFIYKEGLPDAREYSGYIGTRLQMDEILKTAAYTPIYDAIKKFGYTPDYRTFNHQWSSTQDSATSAWVWNSSGFWNDNAKIYTYSVVPFFAIR